MPMPIELITVIAALIVSWLVFTALIKLLKTTISTAVAIALIVLVLQLVFGINSNQLWQQVLQLPQTLWHLVTSK